MPARSLPGDRPSYLQSFSDSVQGVQSNTYLGILRCTSIWFAGDPFQHGTSDSVHPAC